MWPSKWLYKLPEKSPKNEGIPWLPVYPNTKINFAQCYVTSPFDPDPSKTVLNQQRAGSEDSYHPSDLNRHTVG